MMFFGSLSSVNLLECVLINNQECKIRPEIVNVNSNEPYFILLVLKQRSGSKCCGSCNNINYPYGKLFVPDIAKNLNTKL